jgi:phosphoglycerate dehydrogenase-like enzyme
MIFVEEVYLMNESRINIIFLSSISQKHIELIESVDARISVKKAKNVAEAADFLPDAHVVASLGWEFPRDAFIAAANLRWIHALSAGVDALFYPEFIQSDVVLTNSRGVYDIPVAEHAFALLTSLTRGIDRFHSFQMQKVWKRSPVTEMEGKTLGIVGLGSIGREIARKAKEGYNMHVMATKKRIHGEEPFVDELLSADQLDELLEKSDFVVVAAALTKETEGLIGEKELQKMKNAAYIVNIARGKIIQSTAILKALQEGWIAGAGLDVTDPEPLPSDDPLFDAPNLIITPHMAAMAPADRHEERIVRVFTANLKAFLNNETMPTHVDKERRY